MPENAMWPHEVIWMEPSRGMSASAEGVEDFLDEFEGLEDLWENLQEKDEHHLAFRLPYISGKQLNSFGKTLIASMYAEFSEGPSPTALNLHYNDNVLEEGVTMPQVSAVIDGKEYGSLSDYDNQVELPVSSMPDLYSIGLARQFFDPDFRPDEDSNLYIPDSALDGVGEELQEKYSFDGKYEFFKSQGEIIEELHMNSIVSEALDASEE